jgi:hypothetical protein
MTHIPHFDKKSDLFTFLRENKSLHIQAKKAEMKRADGIFTLSHDIETVKEIADKAVNRTAVKVQGVGEMPETFPLSVVINTTNIMDSHSDVHQNNLWNKSLKENKLLYLFQEHRMNEFKAVISDQVKASAAMMTWKDLGYNFAGDTQALVFDCNINSKRNEYMAEQYWKGYVLNHSVGMQYVKMFLCMNSDNKWDAEEKTAFDKYIQTVVNRSMAEEQGYFWAVTEAKVVEGSAVPLGSNFCTPVRSVGQDDEPSDDTRNEPDKSTQKNPLSFLLGN